MSEKIVVIGLGYVGLPVAVALGEKFDGVIGFDINQKRISELQSDQDHTGEIESERLRRSSVQFSASVDDIKGSTMFIVTVPTPIDDNKQPDLTPIRKATETVAQAISEGSCIVYESTVYPGVTEEYCAPILERVSGLSRDQFKLGYSPERINPGDKLHRLETIVKVVSGEDDVTLDRIDAVYSTIVTAGTHRAPSIRVAEAAKVIENTQRDLNIALMNELALIFDRMGIRTKDVLDAAGTKWNFLKFSPGLVGGHCIGVDPYYLTAKAESLGYHPEVILAGRRLNDGMGAYIAQKAVKLMIAANQSVNGARVAVLGLTFKENVPDLRNSRVPDIINELKEFGVHVMVDDPHASAEESHEEYGVDLTPMEEMTNLDAVILAVSHRPYLESGTENLIKNLKRPGILIDVKGALDPSSVPSDVKYWSL